MEEAQHWEGNEAEKRKCCRCLRSTKRYWQEREGGSYLPHMRAGITLARVMSWKERRDAPTCVLSGY